jgi:phage terminase large subunit
MVIAMLSPDGTIEIPKFRGGWHYSSPRFDTLLDPRFKHKIYYGGRAGAKSWALAHHFIAWGSKCKLKLVCGRENMSSIEESSFRLLKNTVTRLKQESIWTVKNNKMYCSLTGTEISFISFWNNYDNIKGYEETDLLWIEEAQSISSKTLETVIPTFIRYNKNQIIYTMNPDDPYGAVYSKFVTGRIKQPNGRIAKEPPPKNSLAVEVQFHDNPFVSQEVVDEAIRLQKYNIDAFNHIWLGKPMMNRDNLVLSDLIRERRLFYEEFNSPAVGEYTSFFYGMDFGLENDPTAGVRCFIIDRDLYIDQEVYSDDFKVNITSNSAPNNLVDFSKKLEGVDHPNSKISCDFAGIGSIAIKTLRNNGLNAVKCDKWNGSISAGIRYLQGLNSIHIHKRCQFTYNEALKWCYKLDRDGVVKPELESGNDHCWDAIRYAIGSEINGKNKTKTIRLT